MKPLTFWQRVSRGVRDPYFVLGSILVAAITVVAVLGPQVAPHNPYHINPIQSIDGVIQQAPFAPSDLYRLGTDNLGRDLLSMFLYGAKTTLILAVFATVVRLLLGLILGSVAGWWPGSFIDRGVTAVAGFLAAIPGLILAMLVIFAVGIEKGYIAFVIGLSVVGFGEIAQIMRGHVIAIRNEPYIEAARSVGLSSAGILSRHVLPNLMATLLALAALDMGAVLLLIGELGFLSIFIGGGRVGFNMATWESNVYFDVPDWGAMLGSSWRWFRSYPWLPLVPAAAFFVAILGFNLFGYGLQRFIERGRFHPSGWSVIRFLIVVTAIVMGARALLERGGMEAQFAKLVRDFDVARAQQDIAYLTGPGIHSLGGSNDLGDGEVSATAEYIAAEFEAAGLSYIGSSYFQPYTTYRGRVTAEPNLEVLEPRALTVDGIAFDPYQAFVAEGTIEAELIIVGNAPRVPRHGILLMLNPDERLGEWWNTPRPFDAALRVVPDDDLPVRDSPPRFDNSSYLTPDRLPDYPSLLIGELAARQLVEQAGMNLESLREALDAGESLELPTGLQIRLTCGLTYDEIVANNIVGYIPGVDVNSRGNRILLAASYADLATGDGVVPLGADVNGSGIAVLLETARLLRDLDMIPKRSIAFAALDEGGGARFVQNSGFPNDRSNLWTVVEIEGVAAGERRLARVESAPGLARAFDQSARRFGVRTQELDTWPFFFVSGLNRQDWSNPTANPSYQGLAVIRPGDELSGTAEDTMDRLDQDVLARTGQAIAHFVMVLGFR
jgi:ABC-type dipeptide/oligopeptide/nickel transport system permease subunit